MSLPVPFFVYTWNNFVLKKYGEKYGINDFSPISQDKGAFILLKYKRLAKVSEEFVLKSKYWKGLNYSNKKRLEIRDKAHGDMIKMLIDDDFERAILTGSFEWASLPGSPYGQPTKSFEDDKKLYEKYLNDEIKGNTTLKLKYGFLKEMGYE